MIVSDAAELTVEWFSAALGGRIREMQLEAMDIGAMCRMVRAELTGAGPASVVVKFPTAQPGTLALARAMRMYELEVRFYRDLLPLLDGVRTPACYYAELDEDTGGFTLVLEDLSARTRPGDVLTESSAAECSAVLTELAALQTATWNSAATQAMSWLADPARTVAIFDSMSAGLEPFLARFGHALAAEQIALFERVIPRAGEWIRSWGGPSVVQHGDLRTDNILFGLVDGSATLLDFQTVRLGPPGIDPAYFLGSSLSTPTRRASERDLLAEFHGRLGVTGFDFDACLRGYREGALYAVYLFCGLSVQVAPSERVDKVIADQTRRYADMALDLDSAELAGFR